MANNMMSQRDTIMEEKMMVDPALAHGKSLTFMMCVTLFAARLISVIIETVYVSVRGLPFSSLIFSYIAFVIIGVVLLSIYKQGIMGAVYLVIVGGVWSLASLFLGSIFSAFSTGTLFIRFYLILSLALAIIQVASMVVILLSRDCKKYLIEITHINTTLLNQAMADRQQK
ncbi:MAG: hypothetical protein FWD65_07985 [Coriobacteriia bacterium]|nr:hypothetical protein [Coriobacteriia bacterium]